MHHTKFNSMRRNFAAKTTMTFDSVPTEKGNIITRMTDVLQYVI